MKIGVFDSGLGGLAIARAIISRLPQYDYIYLGDTKRVPYGNRSQETIHEFVQEAIDYLFKQDCQLIVLACNTASAEALRRSQQEYLPSQYPDRRVLGVLIPCVEAAASRASNRAIGLLATVSTVESGSYQRELARHIPGCSVICVAAPLLVPLVENNGLAYAEPILRDYLDPLQNSDAIILGCTHYVYLKDQIRALTNCDVICPDEVVPEKLTDYLRRHPEIESKLTKNGNRRWLVTDRPSSYSTILGDMLSGEIELELASL